jgi:hypothetical protein
MLIARMTFDGYQSVGSVRHPPLTFATHSAN